MSFVVRGLDPAEFEPLFKLSDAELEKRGVIVKTADAKPGYPCRVTLEDAEPGERVLLLNYESHNASTPYRSAYAIYVRSGASAPATYENELPPVFYNRPIALRIFDRDGMLIGADMGFDDGLKSRINGALAQPNAAYLYAHNAMHGCFAAAILPGSNI